MTTEKLPIIAFIDYETREDFFEFKVQVNRVTHTNDGTTVIGKNLETGKPIKLNSDYIVECRDELENEIDIEDYLEPGDPSQKKNRGPKPSTPEPEPVKASELQRPMTFSEKTHLIGFLAGATLGVLYLVNGGEMIIGLLIFFALYITAWLVALPIKLISKLRLR